MANFKARARALDMLGRQQIASIPTAISELFKNAHDAYADTVEVDFIMDSGLFILRDDGVGMTQEEFEERWLVIGTESKLNTNKGIKTARNDPNKEKRPIMGEKGIGRLAIALIGPQVLVLTRARTNDKLDDLVAAFIHWGFFECPGINLDQIEIPIRIFKGGTLPNQNDIDEMVDIVQKNLKKNNGIFPTNLYKRIYKELGEFSFSPKDFDSFFQQNKFPLDTNQVNTKIPLLSNNGTGTHFYIKPSDEAVKAYIETDKLNDEASKLKRFLLGFDNSFIPDASKPRINTAFRYWEKNKYTDYLNSIEFFNQEDFYTTDHYVIGKFDNYGEFKGTIKIYDTSNEIIVPSKYNTEILCGPFEISFGYIPGVRRDSLLSDIEYKSIENKCERFGGIYIYKDGIRILPYGDPDYDWLEVEKRRSKGATYYFFSYRNMFGAVNINSKMNSLLVEKAGREGFQENSAYREFRNILKNFLISLAANYFRKETEHHEIREEIRRQENAKREGEKRRKDQRKQFTKNLNKFFDDYSPQKQENYKSKFLTNLQTKLKNATQQLFPEHIKNTIFQAENEARNEIRNLRKNAQIDLPSEAGLSSNLLSDWNTYLSEYDQLEASFFQPLEKEIFNLVNEANSNANTIIDQKERILQLISSATEQNNKFVQHEIHFTLEELKNVQNKTRLLIQEINNTIEQQITNTKHKLESSDFRNLSTEELETVRSQLENDIHQSTNNHIKTLIYIRNQLNHIHWEKGDNGLLISEAEISAALETELLNLREEFDKSLDLAQLGMAIEVIDHEFNQTASKIRENLKRLQSWAEINPKFSPLYKDFRNNFEHLDAYLTLLSPLSRRLYRQSTEFSGADIERFITRLFETRFKNHNIALSVTKDFQNSTIIGYPSTFYPVFVNLTDNAIFWLKNYHERPREILLDYKYENIIFSDSGPGIQDPRDRNRVFEYGFSKKPAGRGLGLYIAKRNLEKDNFEIILVESRPDQGAVFKIGPKKS